MNIEQLLRPNIKTLQPYRSARHDGDSGVLLDANENSLGSVISVDGLTLNRYPDPFQRTLRARLAALAGVHPENVFAGVGSDEVIDLLIRLFCEPRQDRLVIAAPTYGMYRVAADIQGVETETSLLTADFQLNVEALQASADRRTKMIFCCSPNNPTGNLLHREDILAICQSTHTMVVVDEAYIDFSNADSLASLVNDIPNLIILRTLSKAWGLAGIRLGYAIASPLVIRYLMQVKPPYNLNVLTMTYALQALEKPERMQQAVQTIIREREFLFEQLSTIPYIQRVFPSQANFLLVRSNDASAVYHQLAQRGIIVRNRSSEPLLENCLRITVGTPEQNELLLKTLRELEV
jgi:histidinol-phosphate aminotransferase